MLEPANSSSKKKLQSIDDWRRAITWKMRKESMWKIEKAGYYFPDFSIGRNAPETELPRKDKKLELSRADELLVNYLTNKYICKLEEIEGRLFDQANSVEEYHRLIEEKCQVLAKHCDDCARNGVEFLTADEDFLKGVRSLIETNATEEEFFKYFIPKVDQLVDDYYF